MKLINALFEHFLGKKCEGVSIKSGARLAYEGGSSDEIYQTLIKLKHEIKAKKQLL